MPRAKGATPTPESEPPAPEREYAFQCTHCGTSAPFIEGLTIREWCPSCRRVMTLLPVD